MAANLTDAQLGAIFDALPVRVLLGLHHICPRWARLQSSACERRRRLTLLAGPSPLELIAGSHFQILRETDDESNNLNGQLRLPDISQQISRLVSTAFPNVHTLALVLDRIGADDLAHINALLTRAGPNLRILKVWLKLAPDGRPGLALFELLGVIRQRLVSLHTLWFELEGRIFLYRSTSAQLPIPPFSDRLKHLRFFSYDPVSILKDALQDRPLPDRVELGNPHSLAFVLGSDRLFISEPFRRIRIIWLELSARCTLSQMSHFLAQLPELAHLKLNIDCELHRSVSRLSMADLRPLPQIHSLALYLSITSHRDLGANWQTHTFPALRQLFIFYHKVSGECRICRTHRYSRTLVRDKLEAGCRRELARAWRQLPDLKYFHLLPHDDDEQ